MEKQQELSSGLVTYWHFGVTHVSPPMINLLALLQSDSPATVKSQGAKDDTDKVVNDDWI